MEHLKGRNRASNGRYAISLKFSKNLKHQQALNHPNKIIVHDQITEWQLGFYTPKDIRID